MTSDGERLDGTHLPPAAGDGAGVGAEAGTALAVVLAHGFTGSWRKEPNLAVAAALARHAGVVAFDFRGHGGSSGHSTVGDREILDVAAAVAAAREFGYRAVVTCGFSMGGAVVLRHAALLRGVDAVVSVSAPARWYYRGTVPMRRVHWAIERRLGRAVARRLLGTRIAPRRWDPVPASPAECVGAIAPTPLLLVHGDSDPYFPLEHAQALAAAAGTPTEVWIEPGFGHAEGAISAELLDRLGRRMRELVQL